MTKLSRLTLLRVSHRKPWSGLGLAFCNLTFTERGVIIIQIICCLFTWLEGNDLSICLILPSKVLSVFKFYKLFIGYLFYHLLVTECFCPTILMIYIWVILLFVWEVVILFHHTATLTLFLGNSFILGLKISDDIFGW